MNISELQDKLKKVPLPDNKAVSFWMPTVEIERFDEACRKLNAKRSHVMRELMNDIVEKVNRHDNR